MKNLPILPEEEIDLALIESWPKTRHRFDAKSIQAVRAAILSGRPLLLRGEPGIGKSQLARAVATKLKVPFLYTVLDERSERDDLFYQYDAIARLAEAQVSGHIADIADTADGASKIDRRAHLAERNFIRPGILWWAFNWADAAEQADRFRDATGRDIHGWSAPDGWVPGQGEFCGPVVLVDEIDKTDPAVPNGLLEGLGNQGFRTDQLGKAVQLPPGAPAPLIFITTNEERELPAAFLRRCLVLRMAFPPDDQAEDFLIDRARVQCADSLPDEALLSQVVQRLLANRREAKRKSMPKPGAAEFLDLVRILSQLGPTEAEERWEDISEFTFQKHVEPER